MSKQEADNKKDKKKALQCVTPKFRASFPELFAAKAFEEQDAKFSIQMLFSKKTDLATLKNCVTLAAEEKWGKGNIPKGLHLPFKDGNEKDLDGYQDHIVVSASSKFKPTVVDKDPSMPIESSDELYAGCYARAHIGAYAWEYKNSKGQVMKKGVSFNLNLVQKLAEGETFVSRIAATDVFDEVEDSSEDASNYADDEIDFG